MHRRLASRSLPSQDGCARPIVVRRSRGDEPPTAGGDGSGAADGSWQPATLARRVTQRPREPAAAGGGDVCERGSIHQASVCCRRRAGGGREGGRAGRGREHRTARGSIGIRAGSKPCNCPPPGGGDALMHENGSPCPSRPGASGWPITSCLQLTSPGLRWWQRRQMREH